MRRSVAINHARFLFKAQDAQLPSGRPSAQADTSASKPLRTLLSTISSTLEKIHAVFSLDSLLLVVSPLDNSDAWLGGSLTGRDFWRGLRGGGTIGAKAFKRSSKAAYDIAQGASTDFGGLATTSADNAHPARPQTSQSIKAELNRVARQRLRYISLYFLR